MLTLANPKTHCKLRDFWRNPALACFDERLTSENPNLVPVWGCLVPAHGPGPFGPAFRCVSPHLSPTGIVTLFFSYNPHLPTPPPPPPTPSFQGVDFTSSGYEPKSSQSRLSETRDSMNEAHGDDLQPPDGLRCVESNHTVHSMDTCIAVPCRVTTRKQLETTRNRLPGRRGRWWWGMSRGVGCI